VFFKQLSGENLEFKKINVSSYALSVTDDVGNDEIDIDVDFNNASMTEEATVANDDVILIYDTSEGGYRKMQRSNFISDVTGGSNVGSGGVGVFDAVNGSDLEFRNINSGSSGVLNVTDDSGNNEIDVDVNFHSGATESTDALANDDIMLIYDTSASAYRRITKGNFFQTSSQTITGASYSVTASDMGNSSIRANSASEVTMDLPAGSTAIDGKRVTFVKTGAGQLTITANGSDTIADSTAGGDLYNDVSSEDYANVTLEWVDAIDTWIMIGAHGTWSTTS